MAGPNPFRRLPKFRRGSFTLFLVTVLLSAILADQPIGRELTLTAGNFLQGRGLWQPFTANFIYIDGQVAMVLGTAIVQWFVGSELEAFWGTRKYVTLVIGCGIVGYLALALLAPLSPEIAGTHIGGATGMDLAAVAAFGVVFGKRPLQLLGAIPLSSRGLAILIVAVSVVSPTARGGAWPVSLTWAIAVGASLLVTTQPWRRLRDSGKVVGSRKSKRKPNHLRVVRSDKDLLN